MLPLQSTETAEIGEILRKNTGWNVLNEYAHVTHLRDLFRAIEQMLETGPKVPFVTQSLQRRNDAGKHTVK